MTLAVTNSPTAAVFGCSTVPSSSSSALSPSPSPASASSSSSRPISSPPPPTSSSPRPISSPPPPTSSSSSSSSSPSSSPPPYSQLQLTDIGANLLDAQFSGFYHGSKTARHVADLELVLKRARNYGVERIIVTAASWKDSVEVCEMIKRREREARDATLPSSSSPSSLSSSSSSLYPDLFTTCGVHPCSSNDTPRDTDQLHEHFTSMLRHIESEPRIVAVGECGLDFDRLHYASHEVQRQVFPLHLSLAAKTGLPLFLHDRNCEEEVLTAIKDRQYELSGGGVVHSFTGSIEAMHKWLALGDLWMIGINGCSLKTSENCETAAAVPLDRLLIETDAPWCEVKATHARFADVNTRFQYVKAERLDANKAKAKDASERDQILVKSRNEPCTLVQIAEIMAVLKGVSLQVLCAAVKQNTDRLFFRNPAVMRRLTSPER